ncbi:hypothetical protein P3L10_015225 [Capsicum annuum]
MMWLVIGWHVSPFLRGCTSIMCFFLRGQAIEVVQKLVPCLQWRGSSNGNTRSIHSNSERLLVLCLLDNLGVTQIARELSTYCEEDLAHEELKQIISRVVQLLTSIPDKAQAGTPKAFSSRVFFKHITTQLLGGAHEWDMLLDGGYHLDKKQIRWRHAVNRCSICSH